MEISDNAEMGSESSFNFTNTMKGYLTETAKWGKFLAIASFVGIGFIVVLAFSIGALFEKLGSQPGMEGMNVIGGASAFGAMLTIMYLLCAVLMFFPALYLFKFSTGALKSLPSMDLNGIEKALSNLKSLFKFYGVFTIIILSFYGVIFAIALLAGLVAFFFN
jgi:hypothetical protein